MRISDWSSDVCSSDLDPTIIDPLRGVPVTQGGARELDLYRQAVVGVSMEDAGRVYIDWGPGTRAWVQRAQEKPKPILEVTRIFQEEAFPGYTAFIANLSAIEALPSNWLAALRAARSEEHTSELQSLMRISYAVFCLTKQQSVKLMITRQEHTCLTFRVQLGNSVPCSRQCRHD